MKLATTIPVPLLHFALSILKGLTVRCLVTCHNSKKKLHSSIIFLSCQNKAQLD